MRPGDHVAVFPVLACGECAACAAGSADACRSVRILGLHMRGAYAEYTVVPEPNVTQVPDGVSPEEAAALALSGAVAQKQLDEAGLQRGERVLVQGASSALGSLTAALASHRGGRVIAASRSAAKRERLRALGVGAVVDPADVQFAARVRELTDGAGVDVVIDDLGDATTWRRSMEVLADRGRILTSGAFLGGRVELDLQRLYSRSQRIIGVARGDLSSARGLWAAVADGFRPVVDRAYPIARASEAHRYLEASANTGRVVLTSAENDWAPAPDPRGAA